MHRPASINSMPFGTVSSASRNFFSVRLTQLDTLQDTPIAALVVAVFGSGYPLIDSGSDSLLVPQSTIVSRLKGQEAYLAAHRQGPRTVASHQEGMR